MPSDPAPLSVPRAEEAAPTPPPATPVQEESGGATAVKERPRPAPTKLDHLPPWRVLLHNDEVSPMDFVVRALTELAHLNQTRAVSVMLEAHTRGVALVLVTHKERAELYRDQFKTKRLMVTIEPAE